MTAPAAPAIYVFAASIPPLGFAPFVARDFCAEPLFELTHPSDAFGPVGPAIPKLRILNAIGAVIFGVEAGNMFEDFHGLHFWWLSISAI